MMERGPEHGDVLDRRIDDGLRRLFVPPARVGRPPTHAGAPERGPDRGVGQNAARRRWSERWLGLAAAAAVVFFLGWRLAGRDARPEAPAERPAELLAGAPAPVCWPMIGPLEEGAPPAEVRSPDLTLLYRAMDACQRSAATVSCGDDDQLAARLRSTYGQEVELDSEAAGLLHGPFASAEWPTGTILTGFSENVTSVLVADSDDTLTCCLDMNLPESSGLQMFTWKVGELVLTEITPFQEPRLLQYFQ